MANQSLYRRYRPRRFSELKGQDHVVKALRSAVADGREGQAYLFSGPRGTGKTTSARILAKVLNCENPQDGEPCCECTSCLSVEAGTSYDVHELDAASNNGVDAMRDLIEKAALGTPGRHRVYILDEVHMLSKGAEAALLKTLEEPPSHVVFVLATTDPQKMSDTIISRTQHLQFRLLGADTLQSHVRWVADDAGLTVSDAAIEQVIAQGAGSPRDALSALELIASGGGEASEVIALDEFVEAMIDNDPGRALKMAAHAIASGRDPRTVTEELIAFLRNGFLSLMAPELVQLPSQRIDALTDLAQRLGAAGLVRGIEHLGTALTEMRQAPDPRVLLDVAIVQLTSEQVSSDVSALTMRLERLERRVAEDTPPAPAASSASSVPATAAVPASDAASPNAPDGGSGRARLGSRVGPTGPTRGDATSDPTPAAATEPHTAAATAGSASGPVVTSTEPPTPDPDPPTPAAGTGQFTGQDWDTVRPGLRGMARAVFSPATYVGAAGGIVTLALPNDAHRAKCEEHRDAVEAAIAAHVGSPVVVELVVEGDGGVRRSDDGSLDQPPMAASGTPTPSPGRGPDRAGDGRSATSVGVGVGETGPGSGRSSAVMSTSGALARDDAPDAPIAPHPSGAGARLHVVTDDSSTTAVSGREIAEQARAQGPGPDPEESWQTNSETLPNDDDVDVDDLVDAPPDTVKTPIDRLAEAFPGSELVDDAY